MVICGYSGLFMAFKGYSGLFMGFVVAHLGCCWRICKMLSFFFEFLVFFIPTLLSFLLWHILLVLFHLWSSETV